MSYTLDVYLGKIEPTKNYIDYALYVTFFPQLLAGPIMKAKDLLPQISSPRKLTLDWFYEGCYLIFWGLFQKVFIADNLTKIVDPIFAVNVPYYGAQVLTALYAFAFQIYCDFAGYSNISIGIAKCMGFETIINFNLPYFATNPQEFWRRWHISLYTWFHDYIFVPISFAKRSWGIGGVIFAIMTTFLLCGLWHGAGWTFILWGGYHGALLSGYILMKPVLLKITLPRNVFLRKISFLARVVFFFNLLCIGLLIFRAQSMTQAFNMLHSIVSSFTVPGIDIKSVISDIAFFIWLLVLVEAIQFLKNDLMFIQKSNVVIKALFYAACCYLLAKWGVPSGTAFIYYIF
jgi:D-alanyl-lipoteichoic acid acyltransferase DltB (MBOAT superfamily)